MIQTVHPEAEYQAFLREGRFMLQRSAASGEHLHFPRIVQPGSGRADLEWVEPSGRGTVYSYTIVRNRAPAEDYVIALIDLDEGVRLMSRVTGCSVAAVAIGMLVVAHVGEVDGVPAVLFSPQQGAGE
jgi:uncharacterized OB-fold protein